MTTPARRARYVRGGLVGSCSGLVTAAAHVAGGGALPSGAAAVMLALVCTSVGALASTIDVRSRRAHLVVLIAALAAVQLLGHVVLSMAAHHHSGSQLSTPVMVGAHLAATAGLAVLISLVEYLYIVCVSVLCWLRLFAVDRTPPSGRVRRHRANHVVVQSVLLARGIGMRAPPSCGLATA